MRALGVAVLVALCACYSPGYRDCEITCTANGCPSGFSCEQGFCRAPGQTLSCSEVLGDASTDGKLIDGSPGVDTDGDTISDDVDNCRFKANRDQNDEDNDGMGDVCDPCPPYKTYMDVSGAVKDANVDTDVDGVGDGCDPNPTMTGDRLLLFDGFRSASPDVQINGTWTMSSSGQMVGSAALGTASTLTWHLNLDIGQRRQWISSHVTINSTVGNNNVRGASVLHTVDSSLNAGACMLGLNSNANTSLMLLSGTTSSNIINQSAFATNFSSGTVTITRNPTNLIYGCQLSTPVAVISGSISPALSASGIGLRVASADAAFDWVMLIDSPM